MAPTNSHNDFDPLDIVYSGSQLAEATTKYLNSLQATKDATGFTGVPLCIPSLDDLLEPGYLGTIRAVQGRPGHGKTSLMWYHANVWSRVIKEAQRRSCVIYATAETMAEHLNLMHAAQHINISVREVMRLNITAEQRKQIETWNYKERPGIPLFVIGMSFDRKSKIMHINPDRIGEAVEAIRKTYDLTPELVCVDYLQILKPNDNISIRNQDVKVIVVGENMASMKAWAQHTKAFWEVGVQAKREVDDMDPPLPDQGDSQWASQIEQDTDSGISITRPMKYQSRGGKRRMNEMLQERGIDTSDKETMQKLAVVTIWKQRMGSVGNKLIKFDPRYSIIDEWESSIAIPDSEVHF